MDQLLEIKNEFDINKIKSTSIDASGYKIFSNIYNFIYQCCLGL